MLRIFHRSIEGYVDVELEKLAVCLALPGQIKKKANGALEMLLNHDEHKVSDKIKINKSFFHFTL